MQFIEVSKWLWKAMSIFSIHVSLVLLTCGIALAHTNYAQEVLEREVTVTLNTVKFKDALTEIGKAANIKFVYSKEQLPLYERITLNVNQKKLREVLNELLQPRAIDYSVDEDHEFVVLKRTAKKEKDKSSLTVPVPVSSVPESQPQYASISGTVTDAATGQGMAGVNVIVKGTTNGTNTDAEGQYTINAENDDLLVFSFIGYKTVETPLGGRSVIDVSLEEDATSLQEVVVNAGYWNVKERENTGNISKVTSDVIQKQPVGNPLLSLHGRMPGVTIRQQSGVPGSGVSVQIRGRNSLRNDNYINEPLYVIDGVPFSAVSLSSVGGSIIPAANPFNNINPSDIESIEVLKDADATSIYGARGSNGVVLITTKKGIAGKTKVTFDVYSGVGRISNSLDLLNTSQYLEMRNEAYRNSDVTPESWDYDVNGTWNQDRYTNWQNTLIGGTAKTTNAQSSISGGNENTQFNIGLGYYRQTNVFPGDFSDQKGSGNVSLTHSHPNKRFQVSMSLNYVFDNNELPSTDLTQQALTLAPNAPALYDEQGEINWENSTWVNPLSYSLKEYKNQTSNLIANSILTYEVLPGLRIKSSMGYTAINMSETLTTPISSWQPGSGVTEGSTNFGNGSIKTWIVEPQAEYVKEIGSGKLTALIGSTFQESIRQQTNYFAYGFTSDALLKNIRSAAGINVIASDFVQYRYNALFARVNYNLKGKYIVNATGRRDGSSRFGPGNRVANFGAIGAAWVFSNENFMQEQSVLSFGKIRTSYGTSGSDQIGDYQYLDTFSSTRYPYQQKSGLVPTQLVNPDYGWEISRKFEAAIELGFIGGRVNLQTSWFRNESSNQLVGYPLSTVTGFSTVQHNLQANVQNTGLEINLMTTNIDHNSFSWLTSFNITVPRNRLVSYPNIEGSGYFFTYEVGKSLNSTRKLSYDRINPETGLYAFKDINENGNFRDDYSFHELGEKFYGGLQNTFTYKGLSLDIFFQFVNQKLANPYGGVFFIPGFSGNQPAVVMDRWQEAGDNASYQKFVQDYGEGYTTGMSYFSSDATITDASFIRLKNVSLSYQLPLNWVQSMRIQNCRVYIQGQNILTFTKYPGLDPETSTSAFLPTLKTVVGGIQLTF